MQWSVRPCELWDLSWHNLLEHLPTPSAFVTPSLPSIVVLNTPCDNMRSHLFTWKSNTWIVPVCSAFGRKSKCVLCFKKKKKSYFFWVFFSFSVLFYTSSHVFFSPLQPTALEDCFHQEGPLCLSWVLALLSLSSGSAAHCAQERCLKKDGHSEISLKSVHSAIPRFPCKSC